jgi:ribosome biogenesis protein YTM1
MAAKQLSTEAVLEVEYVPAVLPPTPKEEHPHDDWISALSVLPGSNNNENKIIAAGCYDGVVRLWQDGDSVGTFTAHKGAIKASTSICNESSNQLITGGADCVARVWRWSKSNDGSASPELLAVLKGHTASVEAVVANPSGDKCVTSGWDGQILMYNAGEDLEEAASGHGGDDAAGSKQKKKRRTDSSNKNTTSIPTGAYEETALTSLTGHTQCVSSLAWPSQSALVTGCWDHSVKVWDPELSTVIDTYSHNKAVHCIATPESRGDASVIAFGGPEKSLRVWDRRAPSNGTNGTADGTAETIDVRALASHTDWISGLAWHPTSEYHLLSISYDQSAKLWDLRASVPLHTLPVGGTEKLLSCVWVGEGEVGYGGADNTLRTCSVELNSHGGGGGKKAEA